jgi:NAD(P)-dependent dehydrogenase (short-subunit alcohol dehydrogenase family)
MSWNPKALPDLAGRTFAVTGGNAGIGYFICEQLAAAGGHVVILGRNPDRVRAAAEAIGHHVAGANVSAIPLDLTDLESVTSAAAALTRLDRLDALIQNAGISRPGRERRTTRQGFELAVGTNHLGHFALTAQALPILSATPGSRVVPVGSLMTKRASFDPGDLQSERTYTQHRAYTQSKHAVQMFGFELDRRLRAAGADIQSIIVHPGLGLDGASPRREGVNEPPALARVPARLLAAVAQGKHRSAWAAVRAATDPDAAGGQYYGPAHGLVHGGIGKPQLRQPPKVDQDPQLAARLWALSQELTGVSFPVPPRPNMIHDSSVNLFFDQGGMPVATPAKLANGEHTAAAWTVAGFGLLAFIMGVSGLVSPARQRSMAGLEEPAERGPGDHTPALMMTTSMAAVNTGFIYMLGVAMGWRRFPAWTVAARSFMCAGFLVLIRRRVAPKSFAGAALWEGAGAALTGAAMAWDSRRGSRNR